MRFFRAARASAIYADPAKRGIGFVGADDASAAARVIFQLEPATKEYRLLIGRPLSGDAQLLQTQGKITYATIDLAELLFAISILGVLGPIAFRGRRRQRLDDFGPACAPQFVEFGLQRAVAIRGDDRGRSRLRRSPAAHAGFAGVAASLSRYAM